MKFSEIPPGALFVEKPRVYQKREGSVPGQFHAWEAEGKVEVEVIEWPVGYTFMGNLFTYGPVPAEPDVYGARIPPVISDRCEVTITGRRPNSTRYTIVRADGSPGGAHVAHEDVPTNGHMRAVPTKEGAE
jgi:hypothetical protein